MADYNGVRISMAHKTESAWNAMTSFVPKKGEIIVYDTDSINLKVRHKIGDGITLLSNLPFEGNPLPDIELTDKGKYLHTNESTGELEWKEASELPSVTSTDKDKYLHTNESTGNLEWSEVEGGGVQTFVQNTEPQDAQIGDIWVNPDETSLFKDTIPIGSIFAYASGTIPTGYLECNGQAISRSIYSKLFELIGTIYGVGDGSTTFNIPNIKGRIVVGQDTSDADFDTLGETGGAKTHTHTTANHKLTISEIPAHEGHVVKGSGTSPTYGTKDGLYLPKGVFTKYGTTNRGWYEWSGGEMLPANNSVGGSGNHNHGNTGDASDLQPYIVEKYIIKAIDTSDVSIQQSDWIVEQGTSGIWTYRKWNSGIAECWGLITLPSMTLGAWGTVYATGGNSKGNTQFPFAFVGDLPVREWSIIRTSTSCWLMGDDTGLSNRLSLTQTGDCGLLKPTSAAISGCVVSCRAKGRWK